MNGIRFFRTKHNNHHDYFITNSLQLKIFSSLLVAMIKTQNKHCQLYGHITSKYKNGSSNKVSNNQYDTIRSINQMRVSILLEGKTEIILFPNVINWMSLINNSTLFQTLLHQEHTQELWILKTLLLYLVGWTNKLNNLIKLKDLVLMVNSENSKLLINIS